jgi:hypothetical protein
MMVIKSIDIWGSDEKSIHNRFKNIVSLLKNIHIDDIDNYIMIVEERIKKNILGKNSAIEYEKTCVMCLTSIYYRLVTNYKDNIEIKNMILSYRENFPQVFNNNIIENGMIDIIKEDAIPFYLYKDQNNEYSAYFGNSLVCNSSSYDSCKQILQLLWSKLIEE